MSAAVAPLTAPACAHCAQLVPAAELRGAALEFCCGGCRAVYEILHDAGLTQFYAEQRAAGEAPRPVRASGRAFAELDAPSFAATNVRPAPAGLVRAQLHLEGVHCAACLWLIEHLPRVQPGVIEARLDFARSVVRLVWDPRVVALSQVARALDGLGYAPHPFRDDGLRELREREDRQFLVRVAVAGALAGNIMLVAFALYSGMFSLMEERWVQLFRWLSFALTVPVMAWPGAVFLRGAWASVRTRTPHIDLPIAIGIVAAFLGGAVNTIRGSGEIYFDSVATLVFVLLVGRYVQRRQQRKAIESAELMRSLAPMSARLVQPDGRIAEVPVAALVPGALVEVRAGDSVPVDGVIEAGEGDIDASVLTGESAPQRVGPGSRVHASVVSLSGRLLVRATETGERTRVGRLVQAMRESAARRTPIVETANRVAGKFVIVASGAALVTWVAWMLVDPAQALDRAVALLIVTCPCALGLATPLAVTAALGRAARRGILIKGGDVLERLSRPADIYFDKTGTLTQGRMQVVSWHGEAGERLREAVRALEVTCAHPIAQALVAAIPEGSSDSPVEALRYDIGGGVSGVLRGIAHAVGSPRWIRERARGLAAFEPVLAELTQAGATPVAVARDGHVVAIVGLGDPLRPDAAASIRALEAMGHRCHVLSGDDPRVVDAVASALGLAARAEGGATPEAKLARVEEAAARGAVVMVGDGVNDAAALSAASVGVAVHGGAEASLAAAHVFMTRGGVTPVLELARGALRTMAVIRRALAFSLVYNLVGSALAATGVIDPLVAAIVMPAGSLTVVTLAFRSRTFGER